MLLYPQVQELYPIGSVIESNSLPNDKWERCYGQVVLQSAYPKLFPIMENPHPMRYSKWEPLGVVTGNANPNFSSDIIYGASKWVVVGGSVASYSSDLVDWTCISPFGTTYGYTVAFNGTTFCSVRNNTNTAYTSTDGVNWTIRTAALPTTSYWARIVWDGTYFLAISNSGYAGVIRSLDGVTWEVAIANISPFGTSTIGNQALASDGNGMVVVSSSGNKFTAYSTDHGTTWSTIFIHPYSDVMNIDYQNGKFLAAMEYQANGYSDDGIDWIFTDGPWCYYGAPYDQTPLRGYNYDDIYRWKYLDGVYFGTTGMNRMVYSLDFVEFRQHIFSPDEDLTIDALVYDSANDRVVALSTGETITYEFTCAYNMTTHFQFPVAVGDVMFERGKHRYIRVR